MLTAHRFPSIYCTTSKHSVCTGRMCACDCHDDLYEWYVADTVEDVDWQLRAEEPPIVAVNL